MHQRTTRPAFPAPDTSKLPAKGLKITRQHKKAARRTKAQTYRCHTACKSSNSNAESIAEWCQQPAFDRHEVMQLMADNSCLADSRLLSHYTASTSQHHGDDGQSGSVEPVYTTHHQQPAVEHAKQLIHESNGLSTKNRFWQQHQASECDASRHQHGTVQDTMSHAGNSMHHHVHDAAVHARHRRPVAELAFISDDQAQDYTNHSSYQAQCIGEVPPAPPPLRPPGRGWLRWFGFGAVTAVVLQFVVGWLLVTPVWERFFGRFVWNRGAKPAAAAPAAAAGLPQTQSTALVLYSDSAETVEWVNMCWRKAWRVYQRGLERWLADLLQPVFDNLIADKSVPRFVQRLRILEFTLDHEAPYFDNMRRRSSRKDSDLNGVVDVRYTGGARMLLQLEVGQGRWRIKIPVLVSDLDLECQLWLKIRLAPMTPYFGTVALAFVGNPTIKVQLLPYNRVRLMRVPIVQAFLTHLLTVDLPSLMVLPKRLEINIPPAVTAVAEAAVGRDVVMKAVASAVLQTDALENALIAALPLGPQSAAGGVSLPDTFQGELQVNLVEARNLAVWGFPWQSNPYCRLSLGSQVFSSRRDAATSHRGSHKAPVWNQEFHFLVTDHANQELEIAVRDSHMTGRAAVGLVRIPLRQLPLGGQQKLWLPVQASAAGYKASGELQVELTYRPFEDDDADSGYREAEAYALALQQHAITDVKSAADASSRAAVAASAAAAAVAVTKAAAARAATKAAVATRTAARSKRQAAASGNGKAAPRSDKDRGASLGSNDAARKGNDAIGAEELQTAGQIQAQLLLDQSAAASVLMGGQNGSVDMPSSSSSNEVELRDRALAERNFKRVNSMQREQLGRAGDPLPDPLLPDGITPEQLFPGIEFRVTEEYDEDSPFSRPSEKPSDPSRGPITAVPVPGSDPNPTQTAQTDHSQGTSGTSALSSPLSTAVNAGFDQSRSPPQREAQAQTGQQSHDDAQREQVQSGAEASGSLPTGIELSIGHDDQHAATQVMDTVNQRPGVKRLLDGSGVEAPSRSAQEQGPLPHPQAQTQTDSTDPGAEGSSRQGTKDAQKENPWWETAADSAWGALEAAKSAVVGGVESLTKGSSDKATGATSKSKAAQSSQDDVLDDVVLSPDLPLEAIAEEMQNTWHLKEVQVEQLMEKAVAQSERPWLILLTTASCLSSVLLTLILLRLQQGGHL